MAETYYSILTSIGKAQIANGIGLGTKVDFVKMKVGDGNGTYYNPTESQLDLVHTVWEGTIGHVAIDEDNPNWLNIEVLIPPDVGGFMIREYAVFDANNNMIAIAKCAETYKPLPSDGSTKEINMKMVLAVSNTSSITLKIDPSILFAKKSEVIAVDNKIGNLNDLDTINKTSIVESINELVAHSSDMEYQVATGSATAIALTTQVLRNGYAKTFIASANNNGAATTINDKPLYKPSTTIAPSLVKDKAYTVWYNQTGDCFFIKASAEGTALAEDVRNNTTFSNDNDTGIPGGLDLSLLTSGNIKAGITIDGVTGKSTVVDTAGANLKPGYMLSGASGYANGSLINGNIPTIGNEEYPGWRRASIGSVPPTPGRLHMCIPDGYYNGTANSGMQGILIDNANFVPANIISGKNIFGIDGTATIQSLGGKRFVTGTTVPYMKGTDTKHAYATIPALPFTPTFFAMNGYANLYYTYDKKYHRRLMSYVYNSSMLGGKPISKRFDYEIWDADYYFSGFENTLQIGECRDMDFVSFEQATWIAVE